MRRGVPAKYVALAVLLLCGALAVGATVRAAADMFRVDDPLRQEPETQDASGVKPWSIDLFIDLAVNLFAEPGDPATGVRAANVNTVDEVPDSNWFTNRILTRPVSVEEAVRGPLTGPGPAPGPWTVTSAKETGFAPGFTMQDQAGETWFVSFDADGYPEAATSAIVVANRIFWTLGYWQAENYLARIMPEQVVIGDTAEVTPPSGEPRRMRREDLEAVWRRANRAADGSFRAVASRQLPGQPLGGFRYYGTRPDDPNDVVPHEHRRELRALKVFGAWTNLVDMKAGNTLDTLIREGNRSVVRHYLQDVGSTFGTGANAPREFDEGWEHLYESDLVWKRLVTLGFLVRPWQTVKYEERPAVGRFEGQAFNPVEWKPRVPTAALRHAQPDDLFWAARRVMAFSDDMIRAITKAGGFSNPEDERHLADVLIQRRDRIGAAYLIIVNPLVNFALSPDGRLSFDNAAVAARVSTEPTQGYRINWTRYDNATGAHTPIGESTLATAGSVEAPARLPDAADAFISVEVTALDAPHESWRPLRAYFRRAANGWMLVGIDRTGA